MSTGWRGFQPTTDSTDPPSEQLRRQVVDGVADGSLTPGDKLPTVRRVAADLGLAPNTVAKAYRELEQAGVLSTRGRAGTFVSGGSPGDSARRLAAGYVDQVRALGLPDDEALLLVQQALRAAQGG